MIKDSFVLQPTNFNYRIKDYFPELSPGKKVGIFFSGGMESSLIAKLCFSIYGQDRTELFYTDNIFSGNNSAISEKATENVFKAASHIGSVVPKFIHIDYNTHKNNTEQSIKDIADKLNHLEFVMMGFTKLFFDLETLLDLEHASLTDLEEICFNDPVKYRAVIEEMHMPTHKWTSYLKVLHISTSVYPAFYKEMDGLNRIKLPIIHINKSEVVDLYRQLGWLDSINVTNSCVDPVALNSDLHCGRCFNCQQRHDAFRILGIQDPTEYISDQVKKTRDLLESCY